MTEPASDPPKPTPIYDTVESLIDALGGYESVVQLLQLRSDATKQCVEAAVIDKLAKRGIFRNKEGVFCTLTFD